MDTVTADPQDTRALLGEPDRKMPFLAYGLVHGNSKKYHSRYKFLCNVTISQHAED
jgi:hypothetical protein